MAIPTASDNIFPKLITSMNTSDPAAPSDSSWKIYAKASGIYARSSNSVVGPFAIDNGAASFPGSPTTGQRVWRTDRLMEYVYNGTVWLSTGLYAAPMQPQVDLPIIATMTSFRLGMPPLAGNSDIYLDRIQLSFFVNGGTALSASHKWVAAVFKSDGAGGTSSLGAFTIDSGASSVWRKATDITIGAVANASTYLGSIETSWTKTGTPGGLYHSPYVVYRYVG